VSPAVGPPHAAAPRDEFAAVAVDVVVASIDADGALAVVLAPLPADSPSPGRLALPGRRVREAEDLETAARRVLADVAGLTEPRHLEQLATFGRPDRDPRGRVVSVSYLALTPGTPLLAGDARWWPVAALPPLGFDHDDIVASGVERLRARLTYSNVAYGLLGDTFTLSELQAVYESGLDRPVDKRNFRKRVLALGMVEEAEGMRRGSHRPAQLYRFARRELVLLDDVVV
jgi:8-oxo-dGTP diphosphatase